MVTPLPSFAADLQRAAPQPAVEARWTVRLLGAVEATNARQTLTRFPSRAVATLLARLALAPERAHAREELIELMWPGVAREVGRNRLRQVLSTLKSLLEPPSPLSQPVLQADRMIVRVMPGALVCDAVRFEWLLRAGQHERARALYGGELMPGYFDEWVVEERLRLAALWDRLAPAQASPVPASSTLAHEMPPAAQMLPQPAPGPAAIVPPSGLPSYWTRTFGADLPASRLRALVQAQRLVLVHGPGGSGKTRLAAEVAQALREAPSWPRDDPPQPFARIAFISMVVCSDAALALGTVCDALRLDGREGNAFPRIVAALAGWRTLLVLDNLEQMGDTIGPVIAGLLAALPELHVLATSRQLLGVDGEVAFELEGLHVPAQDVSVSDAADNDAVALFVDRARAARADFQLGVRNVATIVALVRLLAGMPLAIELAASRVRGLTPHELLQRLQEGAGTPMLDLLARGAQRASPSARHASMRHVIGWSWAQLSPHQSAALQAMVVLAAPAQLSAVAAVIGCDASQALPLLDALHDASLLHTTIDAQELTRYHLLQPVREFAGEHLTPDAARAARQRLRAWLIAFAPHALHQGAAAVMAELVHVHNSIATALADGAARQALELAVALRDFWESDILPMSDMQTLELALAQTDDPDLRADSFDVLAIGRSVASCPGESLRHAEAGLAAARDDHRRSVALVRWALASYQSGLFEFDFEAVLGEAARRAQRCGEPGAQANVMRVQALISSNLRLDFARAETLTEQSISLWQRSGKRAMVQAAMLNRAVMWAWTGRVDEGVAAHLECERLAQADGNWALQMAITRQLGRILVRSRRCDEAAVAFRRSLRLALAHHHAHGLAHGLLHLPDALVLSTDDAQAELAARLHGFAVNHWERLFQRPNRIEAGEMRRTRRLLRLRLGAARAHALYLDGTRLALDQAVRQALAQPGAN